jgi:GMP synthase (glutamine-hydrolysing)
VTRTSPRVVVVDCGSSKVPTIARVLGSLGAEAHIISPRQIPEIVSDLPAAIIISGNPALICETGTGFLADFEVLRTLSLPILGICFGHQVIGMLYDAEVSIGKEDRNLRRMEILQVEPLFTGLADENEFQEDHTEEITLPCDFIHLATSSHCFNEAMMHRERPTYGVQFHPESSGSAGKALIANFLSIANPVAPALFPEPSE